MKKIIALTLCLAMCFAITAPVSADDLEPTQGHDFISKDRKELIDYRDLFEIEEPNDTLVPGQAYYFPAMVGDEPMTEEFFEIYEVSLSVTTIFDRDERDDDDYISSTEAKKYIRSIEYVKGSDDNYYLKIIPSTGKKSFKFKEDDEKTDIENATSEDAAVRKYNDDIAVKIVSICKEKDNSDYRGWVEFEIDLGYSIDQNPNDPVEIYGSFYEVDNDEPITLFGKEVEECEIIFEDGSYYDSVFKLSRDKELNLLQVDIEHPAIKANNPEAKLVSLSFPLSPEFSKEGRFHFYAPDSDFLYEIEDENGSLTLLDTKTKGDFFGFQTEQLGSYVASDIKLISTFDVAKEEEEEPEELEPIDPEPIEEVPSVPPAPTLPAPPPVYVPPAGQHFNPGTGAIA